MKTRDFNAENTIILQDDIYHNISLTEPIPLYGRDLIIPQLLEELLINNNYYKKILTMAKKHEPQLFFVIQRSNKFYEVSKISLVNIIKYYMNKKNYLIENRRKKLESILSYKKINFEKDIYDLHVDGKDYSVSVKDILDIITKEENIILRDINTNSDLSKEISLYILKTFEKSSNIFYRYYFPSDMILSFKEKISYFKNDFESINTYNSISNSQSNKFDLNNEIVNEVLKDIPEEYDLLEKTIHIYCKLCTLFSYDESYFVSSNFSDEVQNRKNIENISNITLNNNKIVCYEMAQIFGKMLEKIGVNYSIESLSDNYGDAHAYIVYRADKYLVRADSIKTILNSDLTNVKLGQLLNGLDCINHNIKTNLEFERIKTRILKKVYEEYKEKNKDKEIDVVISTYKKLFGISNELKTKLILFISEISRLNLEEIDLISAILILKNKYFSKYEQQYNINICILRKNPKIKKERPTPVVILTINNEDYFSYNNKYFILTDRLQEITKEKLEEKLNNKEIEYMESNNKRIPSINNEMIIQKMSI